MERSGLLGVVSDSSTRVIVVSAPAGAGKSVLAQQWAARDPRVHATLRLGAHLDDPVALAEQVIEALETFGPPAPKTRAGITGTEPVFSATLLPALTRLASTRAVPYLLIVDDVHTLRSPAAQAVLEAVCEGVPAGSTVVLLTRHVTPDWLARLRTTGRLTELGAFDLAFDVAETMALVSDMGLDVAVEQASAIVDHTEGWAVGVYLSALALGSRPASESEGARIAKGSDRSVSDYLRTQVLDALSVDHREFLTRTSILDELTGPLCDVMLDRTDSAEVLAELRERIQLVIALDTEETRYRCHHLLVEELRADLARYEPSHIAALHARASEWFHDHDQREDAIRHATASGDVALASRMIWPEVAGCVASGRLDRLRAWLGGLTDRQVASDPWLSMAATWASLQQGDADAMGRWARVVEGHAGADWRTSARHDPYAATLAVLHGLLGTGGLTGIRDHCESALQGLAPADPFRAPAALNLGTALALLNDRDRARDEMIEAERVARELDVPIVEVNARSWLGLLALAEGERERGIALIAGATDTIRRHHLDRLATGAVCMTAQALVLAMRGDKSAAATGLATARRLTGLAGSIAPWFAVTGRIVQARTAILLGDGATARQLITEAAAHMTPDLQASTAVASLAEAERALAHMAAQGGPTTALTTAELRILQFLPSHLTFRQIGEHLFVSQATVKTHVLSIYRKFGVASRTDAVEQARKLGLVEAPAGD